LKIRINVPQMSLGEAMPELNHSLACLRIFGETLLPDEVSRLLGAQPTKSRLKGDVKYRSREGRETIAKEGAWLLRADDRAPADVDGQVAEIFSELTDDLNAWAALVQRYDVDLSFGWFTEHSNEGIELSPQTLAAIGVRGIRMSVDLYAPTSELGTVIKGTEVSEN
jgi:hypothetical protein